MAGPEGQLPHMPLEAEVALGTIMAGFTAMAIKERGKAEKSLSRDPSHFPHC